ncbi:bifunctional pyr operon transcriptional regulator/uracil phosphoribosyltransferase PyrR [Salinisphaera sp. USBA-960]|uniref:bifunctional pyr operon transcriptional regulator/uracil phosphoribosyltransferase PyrR n=1 Tax=Salinisphaera orenii TaxID=856731 RepID=UPI000DBE1FA4|nr:bifunctional pyr operon transcriptional regulator/uracil phosphoribosyltransferase PyrR [Salifodinibacter halophilus]NNC26467.1 bifunctional pyr operon transcriptional regulator/uracil phosphoribosyltransferase PyrR [Salifodinibacter halophilus]
MNAPPDVDELIQRLADGLRPLVGTPADTCVVGIETGGAWVAERLRPLLDPELPLGSLNISFYRDDFSTLGLHPRVGPSTLPVDITDKTVILVDDVLYTGRTVRAALNELFDYGRPAAVRLAALVDRDARELPFTADVVGQRLAIEPDQQIKLTGPEPLTLIFQ